MPIKIEYEKVGDYMLPKIKPTMEVSTNVDGGLQITHHRHGRYYICLDIINQGFSDNVGLHVVYAEKEDGDINEYSNTKTFNVDRMSAKEAHWLCDQFVTLMRKHFSSTMIYSTQLKAEERIDLTISVDLACKIDTDEKFSELISIVEKSGLM